MKATKQYFPVVLFTMLYMVDLTFESVDKTLALLTTTEQYFPVVLFTILCKVVLTFEPVDRLLSVTFQIKAHK